MAKNRRVVVIGAGIGGLTAAALLARRGCDVTVYDRAIVPGGCASTFKRKGFTFDVGATQVAGLESGGIHHRIFRELDIELPEASYCDPACAVYLPGENAPISIWRDRDRWREERMRQFPGSEPFWLFLQDLFERSWRFQSRDPILPPRSLWDAWQLTRAIRWDTLPTLPYTFATVGDALRGFGLSGDRRLRTFLDLQLKLYSQVDAEATALLYAATTMSVSNSPLGLWHLKGSMQVLSDRLISALERDGGRLRMQHAVTAIAAKDAPQVEVRNLRNGECWWETADRVVANVTVQSLLHLLGDRIPAGYRRKVEHLEPASGAFVVYLGVDRAAIPEQCPPHMQLLDDYTDKRSLFVSVSQPGDGRAPTGKATITASEFTDTALWRNDTDYAVRKEMFAQRAIAQLGKFFNLAGKIEHVEAATPQTFARYTGRWEGMVGGVGMRPSTFGLLGFANRTPVANVWLVGDCTHPGEGTAGVSYSALTAVRQILASS